MTSACECFTDCTMKVWRVYFRIKSNFNSSNPLYQVASQQIVCRWLGLGCLISRLFLSIDHSDAPQLRPLLTPELLSVDKTIKVHVSVSSNSAVAWKHFFLLSWGLTLFCKLSSCSLYHLSFSSIIFFSSSSFFTKSISLGRKQGNVVSHQSFSL